MTERNKQIRARADAATKGPWKQLPGAGLSVIGPNTHARGPWNDLGEYQLIARLCGTIGNATYEWPNAEFIAHAREDIPHLLDENTQLKKTLKEIAKYEEADGFPTAESELARIVLAKIQKANP